MQHKVCLNVLVVAILLATACQAPVQPPSATPTPPPAVTVPAGDERVLTLWTHDFAPLNVAFTDKWIPEFEATHPGVKIEYEIVPYAGSIVSFDAKLLATVSSGGGPDVWAMASHNFTQADYIEAGLLAPLDLSYFGYDSVEDVVADYPANSLNVFIRDGKIYGLLNELTTLCLFYNQAAFDDAGITYLSADEPASWKTIGEISQRLLVTDTATGDPARMGYQFGFFANYPAAEWYIQDFYPVMRQYGQADLYVDGRAAGDSPAVIAALQLFYDFTHTYRAYDPYFIDNWFADFVGKRTAMVTAGPWFPSAIRAVDPDVRFGVAPHPVVEPGNQADYKNVMYSFGWVVNANAAPEQQQLAQEFLAFILGKQGEAEQPLWWLQNVGLLQPRAALLEAPGYQALLAQDPWMQCFSDTFAAFDVDYYQHSSDEAGAALVRAINRVVYNGMAPAESARLMQNELLLLP